MSISGYAYGTDPKSDWSHSHSLPYVMISLY
jgi:hypothetical protein